MKEHFLTYEQSLAVKELGFDEKCISYWNIDPYLPKPTFNLVKPFEHEWCVPTPLKSQFFKWVREKKIRFYITSHLSDLGIFYKVIFPDGELRGMSYDTYEQAEDACINKIIELLNKIIELLKLK